MTEDAVSDTRPSTSDKPSQDQLTPKRGGRTVPGKCPTSQTRLECGTGRIRHQKRYERGKGTCSAPKG